MTGAAPLLEARGLHVERGGTLILDIPSLTINEGEILALIGPNGAGKSTLLQALAALDRHAAGAVLFRGEAVHRKETLTYRRHISLVFQEPLLFDTTVAGNVAAGLRIRHIHGPALTARVDRNLERFRIGHLAGRSARTLSGGEAQRTSLARSLALEPEVLFLDEPFAALDPPTREELMEDLAVTLRETRTTTVFATHDRLEALRLADRLAVMNGGRILQIGPPHEVTNRPRDEFVATFVGVETILPGRVTGHAGDCVSVAVNGAVFIVAAEFHPGEPVSLCIRPENVLLEAGRPLQGTSARNRFPARVERVEPRGPYLRVILDCGFPLAAFVTHQAAEELHLAPGAEATATIKATAIHAVRRK